MPYRYDKTVDDYYLVLCLFAIARHILASVPPASSYRMELALSMGLPPLHKTDLEDKYKEHFNFGGKEVEFEYNDIPFRFSVKTVYVWMQGFAAIVPIFGELSRYPNVIIIDIGGFTTDIMILNQGIIEQGSVDTIDDVGAIHFYNTVIKSIKNELKMTLNDSTIESILLGQYPTDDDDAMKKAATIIKRIKDDYASDLVRTFKERKYDLMGLKPVFVGGGSIMFRDSIERTLPNKLLRFIEDVRAISIGYQRLANAARKENVG